MISCCPMPPPPQWWGSKVLVIGATKEVVIEAVVQVNLQRMIFDVAADLEVVNEVCTRNMVVGDNKEEVGNCLFSI